MVPSGNYGLDWAMTDGSTYSGFGTGLTTDANGAATIQLDAIADNTTEGNEVYTFRLHQIFC